MITAPRKIDRILLPFPRDTVGETRTTATSSRDFTQRRGILDLWLYRTADRFMGEKLTELREQRRHLVGSPAALLEEP